MSSKHRCIRKAHATYSVIEYTGVYIPISRCEIIIVSYQHNGCSILNFMLPFWRCAVWFCRFIVNRARCAMVGWLDIENMCIRLSLCDIATATDHHTSWRKWFSLCLRLTLVYAIERSWLHSSMAYVCEYKKKNIYLKTPSHLPLRCHTGVWVHTYAILNELTYWSGCNAEY